MIGFELVLLSRFLCVYMRVCIFGILLTVMIFSCGDTDSGAPGDDALDAGDFIEYFAEVDLPYQVADSTLARVHADSIRYSIVTRFIPDSVFSRDYKITPRIYPLARTAEKGKETYLFVKAVQGTKKVIYLICFDKNDEFLNAMPIVRSTSEKNATSYSSLDKKFQITTYRERKNASGDIIYKRNVYIYNSGGNVFSLILTEPNVEMIETTINPIDTFPRKNKLAGDYIKNNENILSIRDGRNANELNFFVHFEKDKGNCVGELKGTARMISPTIARYKANGNPCALEFIFGANSVTMKETGGCGSYRDIKCFFEESFPRKKPAKPKPPKKKA